MLELFRRYILEPLWNGKHKGLVISIVLVIILVALFLKFENTGQFSSIRRYVASAIGDSLRVVAIFQTEISEPWDGAIHDAINEAKGRFNLRYEYVDRVSDPEKRYELAFGYAQKGYDIVICDAYGAEAEVRRAAKFWPNTAFLLGSGLGPTEPNVAVFDNWIHESSYLAGMWAGALSESNKIGIVAARPIAEVNRLVNAFVFGAKRTNKDVQGHVEYIGEWYAPAAAARATERLIRNGADVFYAERAGVIEICNSYGIPVFGNIIDQSSESDFVVASVVWNVSPTINHVFKLVSNHEFSAEDLAEWSMMYKNGSKLLPAEISDRWRRKCTQNDISEIGKVKNDLINGEQRIPVVEIDLHFCFQWEDAGKK